MNITKFFSDVIGVKLTNQVWSWGVYDEANNRVFLKIHDVDLDAIFDGWVTVYDPEWRKSAGHSERLRHLELVENGAKCYGVVRIGDANFDSESLVKLGRLEIEKDGVVYAKIIERVAVAKVLESRLDSATKDILEIGKSGFSETEKETLVAARVGQGEFRNRVLGMWNQKCAVTGITVTRVIRASHIKPWKDSSNEERLDPNNGLPLAASLDALFDANLISFDKNGKIEISAQLTADDRRKLGLSDVMRLARVPPKKQQAFLNQHRLAEHLA